MLASTYVDIGDYTSAANLIRRAKELEPDHSGVINSEIHLLLARRDFSAARDIVHGLLPRYVDKDIGTSLMAFYEMVIGDTDHAEEIYARLAAAPEPSGVMGEVNLYRSNELLWGMLGAVNLAYLHKINGDKGAARELLVKAREFIESKSDYLYYPAGIGYVLAQIAAIEGNNDAAIEYVREAVEAGWAKPWFGRIDPIMVDLREDARFIHILEELEEKLVEMREHPRTLASNEP
jgi:tetratricopeptide (TPR) repeat protein